LDNVFTQAFVLGYLGNWLSPGTLIDMLLVAHRVVSSYFSPSDPFDKGVPTVSTFETPGRITQPATPVPDRQVPEHLWLANVVEFSAHLPTVRTDSDRHGRLEKQIDPVLAHKLVVGDGYIGKVQEFGQERVFGHLHTSQEKLWQMLPNLSPFVTSFMFSR
jgi:hypothetical protein